MLLLLSKLLRRTCHCSKQVLWIMAHPKSTRCSSSLAGGIDGTRIVWVDLELSGLNVDKDVILEAACIVTEWNLEEVGERSEVVIHQPAEVLDNMGSWCQQHHRETGLIEAVKRSSITVEQAENQLLNYVKKYTPPGQCALAGNTVYMDRLFLAKYMPKLDDHLHYRIIDVSTVKELCRRWNRNIFSKQPKKLFVHRALDDIVESINELKYYKQMIFDSNVTSDSQ